MSEPRMDKTAMFKLSYGLFVLTAKDTETDKDNGCIINTAVQITENPKTISIAVNKAGYTHDIVLKTGLFNLSVLTKDAPFSVFENFGFKSGRNDDKFKDCIPENEKRTENGLRYIPKYTNAVISGKVTATIDCGTHTLFIADVTEAITLSDAPSATYEYYFSDIKPKPAPKEPAKNDKPSKKRYVCQICGFVYEGEELPADFVCPLCNHGADDFELEE